MKKVFLGGSRKLSKLKSDVIDRLNNIIDKQFTVIVGDANGADKAFQYYLSSCSYPHVVVYCAGDNCRNNLLNWEVNHINTKRIKKDFTHYAIRDKKLSEDADYGFMLWDGNSRGTKNNIVNLLNQNKSVLIYYSPLKKFFTCHSMKDFENFTQSILFNSELSKSLNKNTLFEHA